jgi:hypothetical protein
MKALLALLAGVIALSLSAPPRAAERTDPRTAERPAQAREGTKVDASHVPAQYYVTPAGVGAGTLASPGSLATAMGHTGWAAAIAPGDTVFLRAGTYENGAEVMQVQFSGANGRLVTWRNYPNERAVIDHPIYFQTQDYHRFQGLEFRDSRKAARPQAIGYFDSTTGVNNEWINCIIHDTPGVWTGGAGGRSIRGCIIWHAGKHLRDHIVYPRTLEFAGNIVGWTSGNAIELGAEGIQIRSNILWGGGATIGDTTREILLVYPGVVANNCLYGTAGRQVAMHIHGGGDLVVTNNIACAEMPIEVAGAFNKATVTGNTLFSPQTVFSRNDSSGDWSVDRNGYYARREVRLVDRGEVLDHAAWKSRNAGYDGNSIAETGSPPDSVTVLPNADEPKRAHVAIYNWTKAPQVKVDVSKVLAPGDPYALYSAQNLLAGPILTGTLSGSSISVPMTNLTAAPVLYDSTLKQPKPTTPEFGVFVLVGRAR